MVAACRLVRGRASRVSRPERAAPRHGGARCGRREIVAYYERFAEESRLAAGPSRLEFERTKELIARILPKPPARIVDVGGAAGAYSAWLAEQRYEVHLVDASARLVDEARGRNATLARPIASLTLADARALPQPDGFADVLLLMGPLYHLPAAPDRETALEEAHRVLAASGLIVVAAISRYASALDGLARNLTVDPRFVAHPESRSQGRLPSQSHRAPGLLHDRVFPSPGGSPTRARGHGVRGRARARRRRARLDGCRLRQPVGGAKRARGADGCRAGARVGTVDRRRERSPPGCREKLLKRLAPAAAREGDTDVPKA